MSEKNIIQQIVKQLLREGYLVIQLKSGKVEMPTGENHWSLEDEPVALNRWKTPDSNWNYSGLPDIIAISKEGDVKFIEGREFLGRMSEAQKDFRDELKSRKKKGVWVRLDDDNFPLELREG